MSVHGILNDISNLESRHCMTRCEIKPGYGGYPDVEITSKEPKITELCTMEAVNFQYASNYNLFFCCTHFKIADAEIEIVNEVTIDENSAVNRHSLIQSEFNPDVEITFKEAKKTELRYRETVNCQYGCITSKQFVIQQSHLIQVVTDLSNQVTELNRKVDLLLVGQSAENFTTQEDNAEITILLASLPVKDDASFEDFNNKLKTNQNKQAVMKFLAGIGGRGLRSLTANILRRILLDDVAELYSLTGKTMKNSHKKSFLQTETFQVIFQICKKVYEDVTENGLKEIISDWLNQAKVRISRRAERQKRK